MFCFNPHNIEKKPANQKPWRGILVVNVKSINTSAEKLQQHLVSRKINMKHKMDADVSNVLAHGARDNHFLEDLKNKHKGKKVFRQKETKNSVN